MRRSLLATAAAGTVLLLAAGCGDGSSGDTTSAPARPPSALAGTTPGAVAPAPPKEQAPPQQPANGQPPAAGLGSEAEYAAMLIQLSKDLDAAIDVAGKAGDSTAIAGVLKQVRATTKAWTDDGHPAGAGATALDTAGQTAVSAIESPLLLDEAHRQVAAARAALGG